VGAAIVGGDDLEILMPRAAVSVLVLNPRIREPDAPVVIGKFMLPRPAGNLFGLTVRSPIAVLPAAIGLVEEPLVVPLELVIQDDAIDSRALFAEALLGALVDAIDVRVVRELTRPS
jgi:hypothetical protein